MKQNLTFIFFIFCLSTVFAKEIAITFDDAPRGDLQYYPGEQRAKKMISALKKVGVEQALFFTNPGKIQKDKEKYDRLMNYHKAGHLVGNHTYLHKDASKVSLKEFMQDFLKADIYLEKMKIRAKYFRYPYLRRGQNKKEMDEIHKQILSFGYIDGYVTVDTYDWQIDALYQSALKAKKKINYTNLKKLYIDAMMGSIQFFYELGEKTQKGKNLKHVLLLHENDMAALFIEDLVLSLKLQGWKIIKADDAYQDKTLAKYPDTDIHNQGRVAALARANGYSGPIGSPFENREKLTEMFHQYGVIQEK